MADHDEETKIATPRRMEILTGGGERQRCPDALKAKIVAQTYAPGVVVIELMVSKRLDDGKFKWSKITDDVMRLSPAQFTTLIEGLDWTRVFTRRVRQPTEAS